MPLTFEDRKRRMPIGAQARVAAAAGVQQSQVSDAMRDQWHAKTEQTRQKLRRVQELLASEIGLPVEEVFPQTTPEAPPMAAAS